MNALGFVRKTIQVAALASALGFAAGDYNPGHVSAVQAASPAAAVFNQAEQEILFVGDFCADPAAIGERLGKLEEISSSFIGTSKGKSPSNSKLSEQLGIFASYHYVVNSRNEVVQTNKLNYVHGIKLGDNYFLTSNTQFTVKGTSGAAPKIRGSKYGNLVGVMSGGGPGYFAIAAIDTMLSLVKAEEQRLVECKK